MSAGVQMGPNAVSDPQQLVSALQQQQPAQNPSTIAERVNPDAELLERMKAAQVSLERARAFTNDDHLLAVFDVLEGTLKRALAKNDGQTVLQSLIDSVQSVSPMLAAASGGQPPPQGMPPMGGPPGGAPPSGPGPGMMPVGPPS